MNAEIDGDDGGMPPDRKTLAASVLSLLQTDPARYRSFGPYWPLVKALLLTQYTVHNLFLLGPGVDRDAASHMPEHATLDEALTAAIEFYGGHQSHGLGGNEFVDAQTGDAWVLRDPDAGGL